MRTLVLIMLFLGAVVGAVDVGVTAAAKAAGSTVAAGPLLGLWGVGSLIGGIVATRRSGSRGVTTSPVGLLAGLAGGHAALAAGTSSVVAMGALLLIAGLAIAPTTAAIYALVDRVVPGGTLTEAFSWLLTASSLGASGGMIGGGALVQASGAPAACALAGALGALAVLIAIARGPSVNGEVVRTSPVSPLLDPVPST